VGFSVLGLHTGNALVPAYYMMGACAIGALALIFVTETTGCSLRGREIPGKKYGVRVRLLNSAHTCMHD
jgi:hypothetical protein